MDATSLKGFLGMERIRYRFLGHVQHRGFRYACVVAAERAHATGWVRNEADGTVTAEVQGDKEVQLAFIRRATEIVPGYGNDWTIASEEAIELVPGEKAFAVTRA